MEKKEFAILRFGKLRAVELPAAIAHNQREVQPMNANPQLRSRNVDFLEDDERSVLERWKARIETCGITKVRKNAVAAVELFMGFSPEANSRIDSVEWGKDCAAFAARVFGVENIISHVLHRDEKTDHCSTLCVPLIKKSIRGEEPEYRLCASDFTDGREKLRDWQTMFWQQVGQKYGLERGEEGSVRKHVPQSVMYQEANKIEAIIADAVHSIPEMDSSHSESERDARIKAHLEKHLATLSEDAKQAAFVQSANRAVVAADIQRRKEQERRRKAEEERDQAQGEAFRSRKEHEARLRGLPVSSVLQNVLGMQPRKEGNQRVFETPSTKIVVDSDERKFSVFKGGGRGGSGAISAVMQAMSCSFPQATRWLASHFTPGDVESSIRVKCEPAIHRRVKRAVENPVSLEEKLAEHAPIVEANWASGREYLVRVRFLRASWIDALHRNGDIWSNRQKSVCFAHRDLSRKVVGASIRGTTSSFQQTVGSKADGFFRLTSSRNAPIRIAIVESPIEAISLACIERDTRTLYASTAGAGGIKPLIELACRSNLKVLAAQNDDASGEFQAIQTADLCKEQHITCVRMRPPFPDWNDTLRFMSAEMQRILNHAESTTKQLRGIWQRTIYRQQSSHQTTIENFLHVKEENNKHDIPIAL